MKKSSFLSHNPPPSIAIAGGGISMLSFLQR